MPIPATWSYNALAAKVASAPPRVDVGHSEKGRLEFVLRSPRQANLMYHAGRVGAVGHEGLVSPPRGAEV